MNAFWVISIFFFGLIVGANLANCIWARAAKTGETLRGFDNTQYIVREL